MDRHRKQLEEVFKPETKPRGEDVKAVIVVKEEQQEWSSSVKQEEPEPPHIKEEQEELCTSQEGEQLQGLEEADITAVPVKSEDDEEKAQSSQLHHRLTEQMETEADGEDCGGPEPARNSHTHTHLQPDTDEEAGDSSDPETDDSADWRETRKPHSASHSLKNDEAPVSAGEKPFSCSECGKRFGRKDYLKTHMITHTGEKPFSCSVCKKSFTVIGSFQRHMRIHTEEKRYRCSVCDQRFTWYNQLRIHQCVCYQSSQIHQTQTEQMETEADGEDCGGPEPARNSHTHTHSQLKTDSDDCKDTRQHQSRFTYRRNKKVSVNDGSKTGCSDDTAETEPSVVDSEFCKQTREPESGPNHLKTEDVSVSGSGCHTDKKSFSCSESHERPEDSHTLLTHKESPTGEKPFSCSESHERPEDSHTLLTHMESPTGEKPFSCSVCNTGFSDSEALVQHMRIHTGQTQFSCSICGKEFTWRRYLTKHMEVHKIYSCSVCDKKFAWRQKVKRHQCAGRQSSQLHQSQTEENREAEPPASSSAEQMETEADGEDCGGPEPARNSHTHTHLQPDTDDSVDSDFWKETRERPSALNSLKNDDVAVSDERQKPCSCSECGKRFDIEACLKIHMRCHTREKPYRCLVCPKKFTNRSNMTVHMAVHTEEKRFSCSVCDRKFTWYNQLKRHKCVCRQSSQLHHRLTEQIKTEADGEDCGGPEPARNSHTHLQLKTGDSSEPETDDSADWKEPREPQSGLNSLKNDEVPVSAGEKPFSCSECEKRFRHRTSLKIHLRTHTGEKPYSCSVCGNRFHRKDNLTQHMRSHTEEKPYSCSVCKKSFTQGGNLQTHMRIHTGEKRFSCSVCDQRFTWLYQLRNHQCVGRQKRY